MAEPFKKIQRIPKDDEIEKSTKRVKGKVMSDIQAPIPPAALGAVGASALGAVGISAKLSKKQMHIMLGVIAGTVAAGALMYILHKRKMEQENGQ